MDIENEIEDESAAPIPGIRCFIALDLSAEVRASLTDLLMRLQKGAVFTGAHPAWVAPEDIHLTLHFLGSIAPEAVERLKPDLDAVARRFAPPRLVVKGLGAFPNERAPKVIWIGLGTQSPLLSDLHGALKMLIVRQGLRPDQRAYHPHLTLARIKSMRGVHGLMDIVESHKRFDAGGCNAKELILFQSDLRPEGAVYTPLHRSPFRGE